MVVKMAASLFSFQWSRPIKVQYLYDRTLRKDKFSDVFVIPMFGIQAPAALKTAQKISQFSDESRFYVLVSGIQIVV